MRSVFFHYIYVGEWLWQWECWMWNPVDGESFYFYNQVLKFINEREEGGRKKTVVSTGTTAGNASNVEKFPILHDGDSVSCTKGRNLTQN